METEFDSSEEMKDERLILTFEDQGVIIPKERLADERFKKFTNAFCNSFNYEYQNDSRTFFYWFFTEDGHLKAKQREKDTGAINALAYAFPRFLCSFLTQKLHLPDSPRYTDFSKPENVPQVTIEQIRKEIVGKTIYLLGYGYEKIPKAGIFRKKILGLLPIPLTIDTGRQKELNDKIRFNAIEELRTQHITTLIASAWKWFIEKWEDPDCIKAVDDFLQFSEKMQGYYAMMNKAREKHFIGQPPEEIRRGKLYQEALNKWHEGEKEKAIEICDIIKMTSSNKAEKKVNSRHGRDAHAT